MSKNILGEHLYTSLEEYEEANSYWFGKLSDEMSGIRLQNDFIETQGQKKANWKIAFNNELSIKLLRAGKAQDISLYVLLLSALKILLYKYTGKNDVVVCSPIYNTGEESDIFNKSILLRDSVDNEMTFKELVMNVMETTSNGYKYQYYPMNKVLKLLGMEKEETQILSIALGMENIHGKEMINEIADFEQNDLTISIVRDADSLQGNIIYKSNLFKEDTIQKFSECFLHVLTQALNNSGMKLADIELVTSEEKKKILNNFNRTGMEYLPYKTIYELFEEQVEKTPDNTAAVFKDKTLTYKELNERANQVAGMLRRKGVKPGIIVGIMVERSPEMLIGIMGTLKAGGAYLPIDPEYPSDRINYMLKDGGTGILLTQSHLADRIEFEGEAIYLDGERMYCGDSANLDKINKSDDLAYIIYTSGTTGKPKGVMIEHKSLSDRIQWRRDEYKLSEEDSVLQLFSYTFDGFMTSFFTPIISGSKTVFLDNNVSKNPRDLKDAIVSHRVTHFISVPVLYTTILDYMSQEEAKSLRIVTLAGDTVTSQILSKSKEKNPYLEIVNEYGPTEGTVVSTIARDLQPGSDITIGRPTANTQVYILDKANKLMPVGVAGELCISGVGLARGYLNRPELTVEKFIDNPFIAGQRIYKTGDLARWLPDGNLELFGRIDQQVKIRGFRIELGEIESCLLRQESVKEALVVAREDKVGNKSLCAYIVPKREHTVTELKVQLSRELPDYMIPSYFIQLDKFPLTSNGKIDRKVLPGPDENMNTGVEYEAPENETQKKLIEIWQGILGIERIGINDNFFNIGGNSLLIIKLQSKLEEIYPEIITVADLFSYATITKLAAYIDDHYKSYSYTDTKNNGSNIEKDIRSIYAELKKGTVSINDAASLLERGS